MGKKHKRLKASSTPKPPQAPAQEQGEATLRSYPAASTTATTLPGGFELPPTPPDSPTLPSSAKPPLASLAAREHAIETALEQLSLGCPGEAYKALLGAGSREASAENGDKVDELAGLLYVARRAEAANEAAKVLEAVEQAEKLWRELGREIPWEGVRLKVLGLEGAKKWSELEKLASDALLIRPTHAHFLSYGLALAKHNLGKLEEAISAGEEALKARTTDPQVCENVNSLLDKARSTLAHKEGGKKAFQAQNYSEAVRQYSLGLSVDPENRATRLFLLSNRALAYLKLSQFGLCISDCDLALNLSPRFLKALYTRSKAFVATGQLGHAIEDLDKAVSFSTIGSADRRLFAEERREIAAKKLATERQEREERERKAKEAEEERKREWEEKHPDPYKALGIPREATQDEIRKAYRALALKHHPDKGGDPEEFKKVTAAYELLGDESDEYVEMPYSFFFADMLFGGAFGGVPRAGFGGGGSSANGTGGGSGRGRGSRGRGR
ncbi:DnaJ sub C member 7 [Rhodosporidiobolus nylandii]